MITFLLCISNLQQTVLLAGPLGCPEAKAWLTRGSSTNFDIEMAIGGQGSP
jgi:hypothetical protein